MNRLQGVKESDGVITEYEFDPYGNISKEYTLTASGIKTTRYDYDGNNCLLISYDDKSSTRYTYDKSGNLTNKIYELSGRETKSYYIYDGYNRLSEFVSGDTVAEYTYNPEGLRESKTVNGNYTRFIYDGANIVGELTNDNYYIYYRGTELISSKSYGNKGHFYRLDSHGNVTDLVNHLGESQRSYAYTPYGEEKLFGLNPSGEQTILYYWQKETDGTHNPFRYCGEYYDEESGLIYLRNRYYDPTSGRFITEDPARDGNNWYVYCGGNPVNFVDPSGCITLDDGQYDSWTQEELLGYTLEYYNAYLVGDKDAMNAAAKNAQSLREQSSPQSLFSRFFDTKASKMENNLLLADMYVSSLGYKQGSAEYGIALTAYTIALNGIDEKGQFLYDNLLQLYGASAIGTLNVSQSTQAGKWDKATFQSEAKYAEHYRRHGGDFGKISKERYLQGARDLLNAETGKNIQGFATKDGWLFKYNTKTNEFAIGSPYGTISTYFKPVDKHFYWLEQIFKFRK